MKIQQLKRRIERLEQRHGRDGEWISDGNGNMKNLRTGDVVTEEQFGRGCRHSEIRFTLNLGTSVVQDRLDAHAAFRK